MYNHVGALAGAIAKGAAAAGADVKQYQIQETLPTELVKKLGGDISINPKHEIITAKALESLDGIIIGAPTRYGRVASQLSAFFDSTGAQFASGALVGKFGSTFTSTNTQHGGQETTHLTTLPFFTHMGIIYVPVGYQNPYLADLDKAHGGSPYGASTLAGGDRKEPLEGELDAAEKQGKVRRYWAETVTSGPVALAWTNRRSGLVLGDLLTVWGTNANANSTLRPLLAPTSRVSRQSCRAVEAESWSEVLRRMHREVDNSLWRGSRSVVTSAASSELYNH